MDWKDILVAVILTIIGSIAIAYSTLYTQNRMAKKRLLKSLWAEINHNVAVVDGQAQAIAGLRGIFAPAGLKELHMASYNTVKERGFLADLPLDQREKVFKVYDIVDGVRQGRFDHPMGTPVLSPSQITPSRTPISDLAKDVHELESELGKYLGIKHGVSKSSKSRITSEVKHDYNPVSLGTLYFSFSLSLWSSNQIRDIPVFLIAVISSLISLAFFVAVYSQDTLKFLNTRVVIILVPTTFVAFLYGFTIGWLQTFSQTSGIVLQAIVYFGFAWIVTFLLVIVKQIKPTRRKPMGTLTAVALLIIGGIRFSNHDFIAGGVLIAIAILVLFVAINWLKIQGDLLE